MSDDVSSVYDQLRTNTNISLVALVILFYDYLLTFSLEYTRFWECARWNLATVFFFLNRYLALFGLVPVVIQVFWTPSGPSAEKVCGGLGFFHQAIAVGIQVVIGLMLIMRTYALYNRNKWVLAFLCSSGAVVISYGVWVVCSGQNSHESPATSGLLPRSCFLPLSYGAARRLASAWTAMLCFDSVIFLLTLYRSFFYKRDRNFPLMKVMLRDGTAYFGIMTLATASVIYSLYKSPDYERGLTVTFTNVLSSCMLSRLMLNLRDPRLSSDRSRFSTTSGASQPVFTTIISTSLDDNPPEGVHPSYEMSASQGPRRISTSPPSAPGDNSV